MDMANANDYHYCGYATEMLQQGASIIGTLHILELKDRKKLKQIKPSRRSE